MHTMCNVYSQALVDKSRRGGLLDRFVSISVEDLPKPKLTYVREKHNLLDTIQNYYYVVLPYAALETWYDLFHEYAYHENEEFVMDEATYWKCMRVLHNRFAYTITPVHSHLFQMICTQYGTKITIVEFMLSILMSNDPSPFCVGLFHDVIGNFMDSIDAHPLGTWTYTNHATVRIDSTNVTLEYLEFLYTHRNEYKDEYVDMYTRWIVSNRLPCYA